MSIKNKFYAFIKKQKNRGDTVGYLSKDIISDVSFPKTLNNFNSHKAYLVSKGASQEVLEALFIAWNEYINYKGEQWQTLKR